jgi:hypothetical protein
MTSQASAVGTLMSASGEAVLGLVHGVRVSGVPGTFECQPDVPVEKGGTYALDLGACRIVVRVEECWPDPASRRHANGRVLRRLSPRDGDVTAPGGEIRGGP